MDESEFWKTNTPIMFLAIEGLWAPGFTLDDLLNEARVGIWQAREKWDPSKGGWYNFALTLARRKVIDVVVHSRRQKNAPFIAYADLELSGCFNIPEYMEINEAKPIVHHLLSKIEMSELEQKVIDYYLQGYGYQEMAEMFGVNYKKIDNAIQRIMKKLRELRNPDTEELLLSSSDPSCA